MADICNLGTLQMPVLSPTWTDERIELLKQHFEAGLSCREIAADIGVSRNAEIGKLSRLNLTRGRTADDRKPQDRGLAPARMRRAVPRLQYEMLATIYGETEAGGLGRLSILFDEPGAYNLPTDPKSPGFARFWQDIVQGLGALAIVGATVGAFGAFLLSRGKITMEEVE